MAQYPKGYDTSAANHLTVRPSNWDEVEGDEIVEEPTETLPASELLENWEIDEDEWR